MILRFFGQNGSDGRHGVAGQNGKDGKKIYKNETDRETGKTRSVLVRTEPGGDGGPGTDGFNGMDGTHGQDVAYAIKRVETGFSLSDKSSMKTFDELLTINTSGGNGGHGGHGGKGGSAGSGDPPGSLGVHGSGGKGGDGGNAGSVTISADDPQILPIVSVIAKGGKGGADGQGSYLPKRGRDGTNGTITLIANYEGKEYKDSRAGIISNRIRLEHNPDENNGNYRAGNQIDISAIEISNPANIPIPVPFTVRLFSDVDWIKTEGCLTVKDGALKPKSEVIYDCDFKVKIDDSVQIGYLKLQAVPFFEHNGKEFKLLDPQQSASTFNYSINHRFTLQKENYKNISEEDWTKQLHYLESLNPHQQYTACVGMLLQPILSNKREFDDDPKAEEHYNQIFEGLEGEFYSLEEFNKLLDSELYQSIPQDNPGFAFDIAIEFFQHFDESCHRKLMDSLVFASTMGDMIKEEHKVHIRKFAESIFSDSDWVKKNYALVYKKGNRKVQATSTNSAVNLILTLPVFIWFSLAAYFEYGIGSVFQASFFNLQGFFEIWNITHNIIIPISFLGITWLMRKLFYVKSCPRCMSVMLDPIEKDDSSYDDMITHRCLDCGARSSSDKNSKMAQLFIGSRNGKGKKHFLERMPGSRNILYGINIVQIIINPLLWLSLASMTFVGRFDKQVSFSKSVAKSAIAVVGFAILSEVLRSWVM
jgi:hypothetical protein